MKLSLALGAALLALGTSAYAQSTPTDNPTSKSERREKMRAAHAKAAEACKGAAQGERRDCMRREMCAQSKDPAKCEAMAKQGAERRAQIRAACKDKKGDELKSCIREQRGKK
jgi:hypothetical protein